MKIFLSYLLIILALVVLDSLWLGFIAKKFYKKRIGHLFRTKAIWPAIVLFYLLYSFAILYFAVLPADGLWVEALLSGLLLGATAYMTYDLVNYATLKKWPLIVVIVDILWGAFITSCAALVAVLI